MARKGYTQTGNRMRGGGPAAKPSYGGQRMGRSSGNGKNASRNIAPRSVTPDKKNGR